ncbi:MAG: class I SAM-dependent methyltransferase [Acidobacteriota bacterium]
MRLAALLLAATFCDAQTVVITAPFVIDGAAEYRSFQQWRRQPANSALKWEEAISQYRWNLAKQQGLPRAVVERTLRIIEARDEATLYDPVYAAPPKFDTRPNALLVEAVANRTPGVALDVGMGQGRNSLHLVRKGWKVTGFDVAAEGLAQARKQAAAESLTIQTVHASDEEFDFGTARWDLIAILYPIEKRSVFRVAQALKPGGIVVVECAHRSAGGAPFEYGDNELLDIFKGFLILKYEDTVAIHDWTRKPLRLVRLVAQKQ